MIVLVCRIVSIIVGEIGAEFRVFVHQYPQSRFSAFASSHQMRPPAEESDSADEKGGRRPYEFSAQRAEERDKLTIYN